MSNSEQEARIDAMRAGIDHHRLLTGRLTDEEYDRLERALKARKNCEPFILSADVTSATTISGLQAKVEQYQPEILVIDGMYLMDDERGEAKGSPQALTNLTRDAKRLAQVMKIPVLVSTQALEWKYSKKKGMKSSDIGYSSSFAQDSDVVIGAESTDVDDVKKVSIVIARSAQHVTAMLHWDWSTGTFEEVAEEGSRAAESSDEDYTKFVTKKAGRKERKE
jgi:replicative DNA helicase